MLPSTVIRYFRMVLEATAPEDTRSETEKDIWQLEKLGVPVRENLIRNDQSINFTRIPQGGIREETKKGIYVNLKSEAIDTIRKEIRAMQRMAGYLLEKHPEIQSCQEIDRELLEEYIVWFRTENLRKDYRAELTRLRSILDSIGKVILITHDRDIAQMADRIVHIEDGRIVKAGTGSFFSPCCLRPLCFLAY